MTKWNLLNPKTRIQLICILMFPFLVLASPSVDSSGRAALDECLKRALATFAVARGVDAVVSLVQGTEVAAQIGVGFTLSLGQALDPLNDLVEQLSSVLTWSIVSLGAQRIVLSVLSSPSVGVVLLIIISLCGLLYRFGSKESARFAASFAVCLVAIRIGLPLIPAVTLYTSQHLLHLSEEAAVSDLKKVQGEVQGDVIPGGGQAGFLWSVVGSPIETINTKFQSYTKIATDAAERCTDLIVIFLIQTVGLPLLFLYIGKIVVRRVVRLVE